RCADQLGEAQQGDERDRCDDGRARPRAGRVTERRLPGQNRGDREPAHRGDDPGKLVLVGADRPPGGGERPAHVEEYNPRYATAYLVSYAHPSARICDPAPHAHARGPTDVTVRERHPVTGSSQTAVQVAGPILRSTLRPFDFWNWPTTFSVTSPNRPSAPPAVLSSFQPRSMSRCCARARPLDRQRPATLTTSFGTFVFRVLPEILVRGPDCGP